MSLNAVKILGINITISSKKEILEYIEKSLEKRLVIATPNPEQLVLAHADARFAKTLNQADIAIPDGIGVAYMVGVSRIPGVELMEDLVRRAAKRGVRIALIGGRGDLAVKAFECLQEAHPGLRGLAMSAPEIELDRIDDVISPTGQFIKKASQKLIDGRIGMVFVALGAPKQEYVIHKLKTQISKSKTPVILMSVGGSFDIITGRTPRAPGFMRTLGLEWLWRLLREPWRFGRQLALVKFMWLIVRERFVKK